jgi:uncharacterized membrane protein YedE/YeeE
VKAGAVVYLKMVAVGIWLGFVVSQIGFSDYDQLHRMFVLADVRMLLAFAGAVVLSAVGFAALSQVVRTAGGRRPVHRGTVPGAILFGAGWALAGACPAVPLVQLGEGKLPAVLTVIGIVVGVRVYRWVQARFLKWDTGSCLS